MNMTRVVELGFDKAINAIKGQATVMFRSGVWNNYNQVTTEYAIERIKNSGYGADVFYDDANSGMEWAKMGVLGIEMESAALFIVGAYRRVRVGSVFLVVANQEREKAGLPNPQEHDTDLAIRCAIEAIRIMIAEDKEKEGK
jgi:uridine phosphorylase